MLRQTHPKRLREAAQHGGWQGICSSDAVVMHRLPICECVKELFLQVVNGTPYIAGLNPSWQSRFAQTQKQILDLTEKYTLPDVDIIMSAADACKNWDGEEPMQKNASSTPCDKNVSTCPLVLMTESHQA